MKDVARNAPCPCGSGKKYKRCCINKSNRSDPVLPVSVFKPSFNNGNKKESFLCKKYNSKELLKVFALLQLQAQNHGKNIRIELIVSEIINNPNNTNSSINYSELCQDILSECKPHPYEDPPEVFFTENIIFVNGNNIVYPGISTNGTEIVQGLINAVLSEKNLPDEFIKEVIPGILFLLHIHNSIAQKLGHTHRYFEEITQNELSIPGIEKLKEEKNYFAFSFVEIKSICEGLKIPYDTIDQFVFPHINEKIIFPDPDRNPLFQKPFVFIDNEFILVLPLTELICINEFILNSAIKHNTLSSLLKSYAHNGAEEVYPLLSRMKWKPIKFNLPTPSSNSESLLIKNFLCQFDTDKLACVTILTEDPKKNIAKSSDISTLSKRFEERVSHIAQTIKKDYPNSKILLVTLILKSRVLGFMGLQVQRIKNIDQKIYLSIVELQALVNNWKFDKLTIWKYTKYLNLSEPKIQFSPYNTHLSKFDWYKRNQESFFEPDAKPYNLAVFEFDIEGTVRRNGLKKIDKIGIPFAKGNQFGYLQCVRKEEYYPVYISEEFHFGILRNCLLKYSCPIWIYSFKEGDLKADIYMNAILYWLNEFYDDAMDFINKFGKLPISITIQLDESFNKLENLDSFEKTKLLFKYKIESHERRLTFILPIQIIEYLSTSNNLGEKYLMTFILNALGDLMKEIDKGERFPKENIDKIINKAIPFGNKKMVTIATGDRDLRIADTDLVDGRIIPDADISYILSNQAFWLDYEQDIPEKITDKKEKTKLLNDLVALHFKAVTKKIAEYDAVSFLRFLMNRHESLIQKKVFRKLNYPVKLSCYGKFYNVVEEFNKTEVELNEANLSMRVLIEFTACLMPTGKKIVNDDDVDMLLAHILEITNYGVISDEINFDIQNPKIGLLPSGRIGFDKEFEYHILKSFRENIFNEELDSYTEDFDQFFFKNDEKVIGKNEDPYTLKLNEVFKNEWGIALYDIYAICHLIASHLLNSNKSVVLIKESDFYTLIQENSKIKEDEISAFLKHLGFLEREHILKPPISYSTWEVYPWRYNRRLSYLLRPIIYLSINGENHFLFSARHLLSASENILAQFFDGTLKIEKENKKIIQLLAERNAIKGKRYRNEVFNWLSSQTNLVVSKDEIKISPKGFFKSDVDKGDIDILAIDQSKKIVYSIECKNTSQSKIAYDFKREIDTYLGRNKDDGLIQKHINRDIWLKENKDYVISKLKLDIGYEIQSIVISNNILPLKYIRQVALPIFSFYDLKAKKGPL